MFKEEIRAAAKGAENKLRLLNTHPAGYFVLSMLAGAYIGFAVLLAFTVGGQLAGTPAVKLAMGACFGVALSLVVAAGGELFTGNNMVMAVGLLEKRIRLRDAAKLWMVCWAGNFAGAIALSILYLLTGLYTGAVLEAVTDAAVLKMTAGFVPLLTRGILCNILVCLAVWCSFRLSSDAGRLIMIFWCLLAFITTGFEHSIANMTLLTLSVINSGGNEAVTMSGYWFNLITVTAGNMIGGIVFVALPYWLASREGKNSDEAVMLETHDTEEK